MRTQKHSCCYRYNHLFPPFLSFLPPLRSHSFLHFILCFLLCIIITSISLYFPNSLYSFFYQAYFFRAKLPITDYINDTKTVLDQAPRVLNALLDMAVEEGHLDVVLALTILAKMIIQVLTVTFYFLCLYHLCLLRYSEIPLIISFLISVK